MKVLLIAWIVVTAAGLWWPPRLRGPVGGNAASHELGNVRPRPQGFGAAVVLHVALARQWLPGELSFSPWVGGWEQSRPLFYVFMCRADVRGSNKQLIGLN
jgi:hypothetical protein